MSGSSEEVIDAAAGAGSIPVYTGNELATRRLPRTFSGRIKASGYLKDWTWGDDTNPGHIPRLSGLRSGPPLCLRDVACRVVSEKVCCRCVPDSASFADL